MPGDVPFSFQFTSPLRHYCGDGEFILLQFRGLERPLDVIGGCDDLPAWTAWTPEAAIWAKLTAASGPIEVTVTNGLFQREALVDGLYRASDPTVSFTIAAP